MRSNCRESLRLRSTSSVCNFRSPVTCHVMYAEYATTADRVISRPNSRPSVGDRSGGDGWDTPRAYNVRMAAVTGARRLRSSGTPAADV